MLSTSFGLHVLFQSLSLLWKLFHQLYFSARSALDKPFQLVLMMESWKWKLQNIEKLRKLPRDLKSQDSYVGFHILRHRHNNKILFNKCFWRSESLLFHTSQILYTKQGSYLILCLRRRITMHFSTLFYKILCNMSDNFTNSWNFFARRFHIWFLISFLKKFPSLKITTKHNKTALYWKRTRNFLRHVIF